MKTDLERYKELLDSFGLFYIQEQTQGTPDTTLVYLADDYGYPITEKHVVTPENHKVHAYRGFHCYFAFDDKGNFEQVGIYE